MNSQKNVDVKSQISVHKNKLTASFQKSKEVAKKLQKPKYARKT